MSRIMGLDPGSRITGFGIIDVSGTHSHYVCSGCVRVTGGDLAGKLKCVFDGIAEVVRSYAPTEMAIERVFMYRNPDSALKLGQARGAAVCAAAASGLAVTEYTPAQVKQAVVGTGNASKAQVQHMVRVLLELAGAPGADAADALAVALCHAHTGRGLGRMGPARRMRRGRLR